MTTTASAKGYFLITLGIVLVSLFLVYKSATHQSLTVDESTHYYCGLEWWQYGTYTAWPENPVLSRAVTGVGPYLDGHRVESFSSDAKTTRDYFIAAYNFDYFDQANLKEKLLWLRIPVMIMFLIALLVVWRWSFQLGGSRLALLAVAMVATVPTILAHSGMATTDITFIACFLILLWRFFIWVKNPSLLNSVWFGVGLGLGMVAKYSVLPYFFVSMVVVFPLFFIFSLEGNKLQLKSWWQQAWRSGLLASAIMVFLMWAFYGFSLGAVGDEPVIALGISEGTYPAVLHDIILPFPAWFAGLLVLTAHNIAGHMAYLGGQISQTGFWYFYPLSFLVKTPLPFMFFMVMGVVGAVRSWKQNQNWELLAILMIPIGILISTLPSHINLGLRHVLTIYPLLAIGAGFGIMQLVDQLVVKYNWVRIIPAVFVVWQLTIAIVAFPFYLSYFNWFGGKEPGKIVLDSDLDWSQGFFAIEDFSNANSIDTLNIAVFAVTPECLYDLPPLKMMAPNVPVKGWVAVSEYFYQGAMQPSMFPIDEHCSFLVFKFAESGKIHNGYHWLDQYPVTKIAGGAIRMYHIE